MSVDVGSAVGYLDLDISGFLAGLQSAQSAANTSCKNIVTSFGNSITGLGKGMTGLGKTLTKSVTVPLAGVSTAMTKFAAGFESGMSEVSAISGATGEDYDKLRNKAMEMADSSVHSATKVTEAFKYMAMAGWDTEEMLYGIEGILNLATASGEDLGEVSDIVTDGLTAFGMGADETTRFVNVLAKTAASANTDVGKMGETFKYVAPVAGSLGYEVEDMAVAIGLMANRGIKATQAGTTLRTSLSRLAKPTKEMQGAMNKYGISLTDTTGKIKPFKTLMDELRAKLGGLSEAQKAQVVTTIFGRESMTGMLAIIDASEEEYTALTEDIFNCKDAAEKMADTMSDNLNGQISKLKASLGNLAIELGDILLPHLKNVVSKVQELVTKFRGLSKEQKEQIVKWAGIAMAAGPVLTITGKLVTGFGKVITTIGKIPKNVTKLVKSFKNTVNSVKNVGEAFKLSKAGFTELGKSTSKLGAALAGVSLPMVLIITLVAALIAAFVHLWKNNEEFREKIKSIWEEIKETISVAIERIKYVLEQLQPVFDVLKAAFEAFVDFLKILWEGFCELVAPLFTGAFQIIADTISAISEIIYDIVQGLIDLFSGDFEGAMENFGKVFEDAWEWVCDVFEDAKETILEIAETICNWFGTTWDETWSGIKEFFSDLWEDISTAVSEGWETICAVFQVGIMVINEIMSFLWFVITLPFQLIWENCKDIILDAWEYIKTTVSDAIEKVSQKISEVWEHVSGVFEEFWTPISEYLSEVWEDMCSEVSRELGIIKKVINDVLDRIKKFFSNIWEDIKKDTEEKFGGIKEKISTGIDEAKKSIDEKLDKIKQKFTEIWDKCKETVTKAIDKIKSAMNFSWSLPKLKLPHISITGSFSLRPPRAPHFSVSWYKSAMENGMILNSPTIFGFDAATGKLLGGGEAGSETVVGTKSLMKMIRTVVEESMQGVMSAMYEALISMRDGFVTSADKLIHVLAQLVDATQGYTTSIDNIGSNGVAGGINYSLLARILADILKSAPIQANVDVHMDDGDVYLDKERVGRTVAPVVSRVLVQGK